MAMKIEVCAKHEVPLSHVNGVKYCKECKDYVYPASIKTVTVHTQAELDEAVKAAKIEGSKELAKGLRYRITEMKNRLLITVCEESIFRDIIRNELEND